MDTCRITHRRTFGWSLAASRPRLPGGGVDEARAQRRESWACSASPTIFSRTLACRGTTSRVRVEVVWIGTRSQTAIQRIARASRTCGSRSPPVFATTGRSWAYASGEHPVSTRVGASRSGCVGRLRAECQGNNSATRLQGDRAMRARTSASRARAGRHHRACRFQSMCRWRPRGALLVRTCEGPIPAAHGDIVHARLGSVVRYADATVVEEASEQLHRFRCSPWPRPAPTWRRAFGSARIQLSRSSMSGFRPFASYLEPLFRESRLISRSMANSTIERDAQFRWRSEPSVAPPARRTCVCRGPNTQPR